MNEAKNDILKDLPKGWQLKTLDKLVDILDNKRIPVSTTKREKRIAGKKQSELFPYYGATQQNGWIDDYLFDEELILLGEDGVSFLDKDKHKAYIISGKSWVNNHAHVLRAKRGAAFNQFICFYLNTFDYTGIVAGATRLKLTQGQMKDISIPTPPLEEQKKILDNIHELFSRIDKSIQLLNENLGHISYLLPSALNDLFENVEEKGWKLRKLNEVALVARGKSKHRPRNERKLFGGIYPFIQTSDVRNANKYITKYSQTYSEFGLAQSKLWSKGTVCMTIAANIGDVAILGLDACFPDSVVGIQTNSKCNSEYLYYYLQTLQSALDKKANAAAQKNISLNILADVEVPTPSIDI